MTIGKGICVIIGMEGVTYDGLVAHLGTPKWGPEVTKVVVDAAHLHLCPGKQYPAAQPAPAPAAPAPAAPAPVGPLTTFGNGTYLVGEDVAPGKYRSPGVQDSIAPLCYWDLTDDSGTINDQGVANEGPSRATLREGLTFTSQGCEDWVLQNG